MAAKGNYIIIDETVLSDSKIKKLIKASGYEAFGLYIALLTTMRAYNDTCYKIPLDDLEDIAEWDLRITEEEDIKTFTESVACMINVGLLSSDDNYIWSERRKNDLLKQEEAKRKMSIAGQKGMATRYGKGTL